jgi:hypothetical protein
VKKCGKAGWIAEFTRKIVDPPVDRLAWLGQTSVPLHYGEDPNDDAV